MKRNHTLAAALIATCALLTSACSTASLAGQTARGEQPAFDPIIQQATANFPEPLPEGVQWPRTGIDLSDPAVNPDRVEKVVAHPSMNDEMLAGYWLCSWMDVYLRAVDEQDLQKQNQAVINIGQYTSLPAVQTHLDNPEDFDLAITTSARNGDPTLMSEFYGSSCDIYQDNQPAQAST